MPMLSVWKNAWLCSLSLAVATLVGCATGSQNAGQAAMRDQLSEEPALCQAYRNAWVSLFKANVQALSNDTSLAGSYQASLDQVRRNMNEAGVDAETCSKPYCMIQPLQGGKLDSYCGYRIAAREGNDLYQWVPWTGQ